MWVLTTSENSSFDRPEPALLAEVRRNGFVESRHRGHVAVVDADGHPILTLGDPSQLVFARSSLKPLQAWAAAAAGTDLTYGYTPAELAVTCASHAAEPRHRAAVASILRKIEAAESDLHCGPHPVPHEASRNELVLAGRRPTAIYSNCSGKHSGMLALARRLGAPLGGYWETQHPVQRAIQATLRLGSDLSDAEIPWGVDGCGVPNYLLPLHAVALGFARLAQPDRLQDDHAAAANRITTAMNLEPEMVRGEGGFDSVLMRQVPGRFAAKGGAEAFQAISLLHRGIGIAVKIEDGEARAIPPFVLRILQHLGELPDPVPAPLLDFYEAPLTNTRGDRVGEIVVVPTLA